MPWTAQTFRARHNKKMSLEQALKASEMANAMLRKGVPEGEAIRTANARTKRSLSDLISRRD